MKSYNKKQLKRRGVYNKYRHIPIRESVHPIDLHLDELFKRTTDVKDEAKLAIIALNDLPNFDKTNIDNDELITFNDLNHFRNHESNVAYYTNDWEETCKGINDKFKDSPFLSVAQKLLKALSEPNELKQNDTETENWY